MKKAKFILGAIAVFAVVGGVYASKARLGQIVYTRANPAINACTVPVSSATFATTGDFKTNTYATLVTGPCLTTHSIYEGL